MAEHSKRSDEKRVCIITPGHLATNPRVLKEASALSAAGYQVSIITGDYLPGARIVDLAISHPAWQIKRVPFGPLQSSRLRYLVQTLRRRAARILMRARPSSTGLASVALATATNGLIAEACATRADLYIAHYVAALPAAAQAARYHLASYAFDAEDFHLGDLSDAKENAFEKLLIRTIESSFLPEASYVTAAAPGIAEAYASEYGIKKPTVVLNTFSKADAPSGPTPAGSTLPGPTIYWFSQTIGPGRGLECAVSAIAKARTRPHLHLRGTVSADFADKLRKLAESLGVSSRLHLHSLASPNDMTRLALAYDVGLVSETGETLNRRIALTNKQFTYLIAGVPAIMSDVPAHVSFAADAPGAVFLYRAEDPVSLASVIDELLDNQEKLATARAQAFRFGQDRFNWEIESISLLASVTSAIAARTAL